MVQLRTSLGLDHGQIGPARVGGAHGRSGRVRKISSPPAFDSRTVQPVVTVLTTLPRPDEFQCTTKILCLNKKMKLLRLADYRDKLRNADSNGAFYFSVYCAY